MIVLQILDIDKDKASRRKSWKSSTTARPLPKLNNYNNYSNNYYSYYTNLHEAEHKTSPRGVLANLNCPVWMWPMLVQLFRLFCPWSLRTLRTPDA
jgi:hypothetical protein